MENNRNEGPAFIWLALAYLISFISLPLLQLNKSGLVRRVFEILLFSSVFTDLLYILLGGFPFSYPDALNLFNNPEYASGALITFRTGFLLAFAGAAIFFGLVRVSVKNLKHYFSPFWVLIFVVMLSLVYACSKFYPGVQDYSSSIYRLTANLLTGNSAGVTNKWRREPVVELPAARKVEHIFLVVDESVSGPALSINGFDMPTTPFLKANAKRFINFGIASSFTNYSSGSNFSLLSGLLYCEMPDKNFRSFSKPGIFQYAKVAGYQTFLLDAQSNGNRLQNYTDPKDLAFIDSVFKPGLSYPELATYSRDSVIAEKLIAISKSHLPTFVYVNKSGAHWPYSAEFPKDSLLNHFNTPGEKLREHSISYFKSIVWNVDRFWERTLSKLPVESNVLIIYTSDHGENYDSRSYKVKHASIYKTPQVEGMVPLMVFDQADFFPKDFVPVTDKYSHQFIFPTLITAMGYDGKYARRNYGKTLMDPPDPGRGWFHAGDLFGRGKNQRVYINEDGE